MSTKAIVFVDGFNVYHALDGDKKHARRYGYDADKFHKYKWLDLTKLAGNFLLKNESITETYYFTALHWTKAKSNRHKHYINALENTGVQTVYGEFKNRHITCKSCNKTFEKREEKKTDVNIATHLLALAARNSFDKAIIISGDNDLIPAIQWLHTLYPKKKVHVIIPIARSFTDDLKDTLQLLGYTYSMMKEKHLKKSQMPDVIELENRTLLNPYQPDHEE